MGLSPAPAASGGWKVAHKDDTDYSFSGVTTLTTLKRYTLDLAIPAIEFGPIW